MPGLNSMRIWAIILPIMILCAACQTDAAEMPPTTVAHAATTQASPKPSAETEGFTSSVEANTEIPEPGHGSIGQAEQPSEGRERTLPVTLAIVKELNLERSRAGRPALQMDAEMVDLAFDRAEDLVRFAYFDHVEPSGMAVPAREAMVGAGYTGKLAEVLIAVFGPLEAAAPKALQGWWQSEAHRTVLMDPAFRYVGVGMASDQVWWKIVVLLAETEP